MTFSVLHNFLIFGLVAIICFALMGLIFFRFNVKKIASLSVAYSSLVLLLLIIASLNPKIKELYTLLTTILIIFSVNLICAIGIISNIEKLESKLPPRNKD